MSEKMYCLNYDTDHGDREEWNIFYTPTEVFSTVFKREARKTWLKTNHPEFEFHEFEAELDSPAMAPPISNL